MDYQNNHSSSRRTSSGRSNQNIEREYHRRSTREAGSASDRRVSQSSNQRPATYSRAYDLPEQNTYQGYQRSDPRQRSARQSSARQGSSRQGGARQGYSDQNFSYSRDAYASSDARRSRRSNPEIDAQASPYSRSAYAQGYGGLTAMDTQRKRRGKRVRKGLLIALIAVVVILAAAGVAAALYVNNVSNSLHEGITEEVKDSLVETEYSKEPFYMLLLGTDESEERNTEEADVFGGAFRSDSMMLARIDCSNKKVTLISLERDTYLDMGEYGWNKLNAASLLGGPAYAIQTVSNLAGVGISHYAQIDFDGFCSVVDTLGGIEVDVPMEIDDSDAGGHLDAGLQTLNGEQALILCRSRNAYNDYGSGNTYRSANQRLVLSAIAKKILSADLPTIAATVTTLSNFISTDLEISDIIGIAQALRGLDITTDMYTAMQPTTSVYQNDLWYNVTNEDEWTTMMQRVDAGLPPTETDQVDATGTVMATTGSGATLGGSSANIYTNEGNRSGTIVVRNGGASQGSAASVAQTLTNLGYTTDVGNADKTDYTQTLIIFNEPSQRAEALDIAQRIGKGQLLLNNGDYTFTGNFMVILGTDYSNTVSVTTSS